MTLAGVLAGLSTPSAFPIYGTIAWASGIVQRLSLESCRHPVHLFYPESGQAYVDALCRAAIYKSSVELVPHPIALRPGETAEVWRTGGWALLAGELDHSVPTLGFRIEEPEGRRFLPERLAAAGVSGPMVGEIARRGRVRTPRGTVRIEEVSAPRPGNVFAFVMDTRCRVARNRPGPTCCSWKPPFSADGELAARYGHATAADAARRQGCRGGRQPGHFSQRYPDTRARRRPGTSSHAWRLPTLTGRFRVPFARGWS